MRSIVTIATLFFSILLFSQESDLEKLKKDVEEIKKNLTKDERNVQFGVITFNLNDVEVYKKNSKKPFKKIDIQKIILSIVDGCIVKIKVFGDGMVFYNHDASIAITKSRFRMRDNLQTEDRSEFLIFNSLLAKEIDFESYTPKDQENIVIDKDNLSYTLEKDVSLNGLIDTRIYSDVLGFFGEEKNSIVQTEVKSKFILNRTNVINSQLIPMQYLTIWMNYNKIDSKNRYINSSSFVNSDLIQKSIFNAELGLNVLKFNPSKNNHQTTLYGEVGTIFSWNKLAKNTDTLTVKSISFYTEAGIKTKFYKQLGVNAGIRLIRLMSPETKEFSQNLNEYYFNFMRFNLDLFYLLDDKKSNRLFLRFNYFKSTDNNLTNNQFPQIQVGYSKLFTSLF